MSKEIHLVRERGLEGLCNCSQASNLQQQNVQREVIIKLIFVTP